MKQKQEERDLRRTLLVLELQQFKQLPILNPQNEVEVFRAKYLLMLQLKFSPFIESINFICWR